MRRCWMMAWCVAGARRGVGRLGFQEAERIACANVCTCARMRVRVRMSVWACAVDLQHKVFKGRHHIC